MAAALPGKGVRAYRLFTLVVRSPSHFASEPLEWRSAAHRHHLHADRSQGDQRKLDVLENLVQRHTGIAAAMGRLVVSPALASVPTDRADVDAALSLV
jgi:hypothetical protein